MQHSPFSSSSGPRVSAPHANAVASMGGGGAQPLPMLEISLQRLEEIVEQETAALKSGQPVDLKAFNDRKSQALLELTRWLRNMPGLGAHPDLAARVGSLKEKLALNQAALKLHLEAVQEISASLADAIQQSESDGTYTQAISSAASSAARRYYD